jgi:hypothetical protein
MAQMTIQLDLMPSPLALVASRLKVVGHDQSTDTFMAASYLCEAALKLIGICFHSGLEEKASQHAYRVGYDLVRADGLGTWPANIVRMTSMPLASFLPSEFALAVEWFTRKRTRPEDEWCREALAEAHAILSELGVETGKGSKETVRAVVAVLVQIRNKTKAHGALGPDFYEANNPRYITAINLMIAHCPFFLWRWYHLSSRPGKPLPRGVKLLGPSPAYMDNSEVAQLTPKRDGVYIQAPSTGRLFYLGNLLGSTRECREFTIPNGNFRDADGMGEALDYASGSVQQCSFVRFLDAPAPLPPSETQGLALVDVQSNVFGNLPGLPQDYVHRIALETELSRILCDHNHGIVTLHGNGGMGKTYLALAVAHQLSQDSSARFENIVWFSARDLDLRISGARAVQPQVVTLLDVCSQYGFLFAEASTTEAFAKVLQGTRERDKPGTLFIFDNFETMQDLTELHRFLDQHTTSPNKVLLTSRERAFKADYPIEVKGMEKSEAQSMLRQLSRELHSESLLTDKVIDSIYDQTKGHPYVMKVLVGEMAKEKRYLSPVQVLSSRSDVAHAIFERSFAKLSDSARAIFLTVANWRSYISELSLLVVLGLRGIDVDNGLDECLRLSLIYSYDRSDGDRLYYAPELARNFGKKKLEGDPDRLVIQADIEVLRQFGVTADPKIGGTQSGLINRFVKWCKEEARQGNIERLAQIDTLLETLAGLWPEAWLDLGVFRRQIGASSESIETALRRAVEENPNNAQAWQQRADHAKSIGDERTYISCLVSAVDSRPKDVDLVKEVAFQLAKYVKEQEIPPATRYVFLSSVRQHMQALEQELDAVGLSRLAWLYLLENDQMRGKECALRGLAKDSGNIHCLRIIEHLNKAD